MALVGNDLTFNKIRIFRLCGSLFHDLGTIRGEANKARDNFGLEKTMQSERLTLGQYNRLRERTHDYARALQRTNLALRCLQRRAGVNALSQFTLEEHRGAVLALFWNHLVQSHYRRNGIDVTPASACDQFPYYASVRRIIAPGETEEISKVTTGSTRIDAPWTESQNLENPVTVINHISSADDPLFGLDNAVTDAVGSRFLSQNIFKDHHRFDHETYLIIHQVVTVLTCMGVVRYAIRGVEVDMHLYGVVEEPTHPLRRLGVLPHPCFTEDWFDLEGRAFIHRNSGALLIDTMNELVSFDIWCGGHPDQGVSYIFERLPQLSNS